MDRLIITQRIKINATYYKNGNSVTATYRALRGDCGLHNRPTTKAIGKIVKKFEERLESLQILKGLCIIVLLVSLKISLL